MILEESICMKCIKQWIECIKQWIDLIDVDTCLKSESESLSHVQFFATPRTVAHQDPLSMEFSRQECWTGLPFPSPGDFPNPGIVPGSPALQADSLPTEQPRKPLDTCLCVSYHERGCYVLSYTVGAKSR